MQVPQGLFGSPAQQQQGYAQTGANIGRVLGRLFGLKDPALESRRILGEVNYSDPDSLQTAAQELARMGMVDEAMSLAQQARQQRAFGLEERKLTAAEERAKGEAEDRAKRLELSGRELDLRLKELENRKDLTAAQVNEINARIKTLGKGNYSIREQKGGITGTETIAFVAVNEKDPTDIITIPVTPAAATPPAAGATPPANRPPLGSFGASR